MKTSDTDAPKPEQRASELIREWQLAERWKMSARTLQRWRTRQLGPSYVSLGRSIRYRLSDVEAYELRGLHDRDRAGIEDR